MGRIRTIKPEFCSSADTGALSRDARLFFLQLLTEADDHGRLLWLPRRLCGVLYPHDEEVDSALLTKWKDECCARGMLDHYAEGKNEILQVSNWTRHQKVDHPAKSRLPAPTDQGVTFIHVKDSESLANTSRDSREVVEPDLGTGKGKEQGTGKGKKPRAARAPKPDLTLTDWTDTLPDGSFAIPPEDPIFDWAAKAGIPPDWIDLAWRAFADRYGPNGAGKAKRYADWRAVFRTAVKDDWLHVWRHTPQGFVLTTVGETWKRAA